MDVKVGKHDSRELAIRFHTKDEEEAQFAIGLIAFDECPKGYRWTKYSVSRTAGRGQRCSVTVVIQQKDSRKPTLHCSEALELFAHIEVEALR